MDTFLAEIVSLFASCEQEMNAVERLLHYKELVSEGNPSLEAVPPSSWPSDGRIEFSNVKMSYREGLPVVLKGVSFSIRSGEKVNLNEGPCLSGLTGTIDRHCWSHWIWEELTHSSPS